jgi:protein TonB
MFTSPWMNPPDDRRPAERRRAWILTSSVVLHGLALATLAGFETWRVAAVAEPPVAAVFEVQLPLPPLPPPPSPRTPPAVRRQAASPRPQSIAPATPAVPATPPLTQPDPKAPPHEPSKQLDPALADPATPAAPGPETSGPGGDSHGTRSGSWGPGGDDDRPLPVGGRIRPPQIVPGTKVQPHYTEQARQARLQGVVVLQATIDERGNVIDVHLLKTMRFGLDEEAVKAVSQWKFTPALLDGRPVKVYFDLTVQFEVR